MKTQNLLKITLVATITLFVGLLNYASAQDQFAIHQITGSRDADNSMIISHAAYPPSFQAVVFRRLNGNIAVHVQKTTAAAVKVMIYNSKGQLIRKDKLMNHNLISRDYVLESFPKDTYTFKITSHNKVYSKEIYMH